MNSKRSTVEELVNETSIMRLKILQHAAEISPYVKERTLGPDKKDFQIEVQSPTNNESAVNVQSISKSPAKSPKVISPVRCLNFENLDFETINATILLREADRNRRKSIRKQIEGIQKHACKNQIQLEEMEERLKAETEKRLQKQIENEQSINEQASLQTQRQLMEEEREIMELRKQNQQNLQMITVQALVQYQKKFRIIYEKVAKVLLTIDKQILISAEEHNQKLKSFVKAFDLLISKIRNQETGTAELKIAENLCNSIAELEEIIIQDARQQQGQMQLQQEQELREQEKQLEIQKQQQMKKQAQAQAQALQQQHQQQQQQSEQHQITALTVLSEEKSQSKSAADDNIIQTEEINTIIETSSQFVSRERFEFYTAINKFYTDKVEKVKPLQSDDNMKKYRFACQKAINIPVNAISAVSQEHLQDKFEKLYSFISGNPLKTAGHGQITVNDHPLGRDYCILLMAKKFVSQGDTAISSNPQAAFPVASVIVSLWKLVPEFGQLFLAYTFKESPFLVPYFIPQKRGQSVEEYSKTLGYRVTDGVIENQDMYLKRQSGIARLYSAVMITPGRCADGSQHPYGIENGWIWLTNFITLHPLPDICATLMLDFLHNAAADMLAYYDRQFRKLLYVIKQQYFPKLSAVDEGGPKARLEILLGKYIKEGQIPKPQGILPANFW